MLTLEGEVCCGPAPFVVDLLYQELNQLVLLLERVKERCWLYILINLSLKFLLDVYFNLLRGLWHVLWDGDLWNGRPR